MKIINVKGLCNSTSIKNHNVITNQKYANNGRSSKPKIYGNGIQIPVKREVNRSSYTNEDMDKVIKFSHTSVILRYLHNRLQRGTDTQASFK